jgi:hypothetical protein
MSGSHAPPTYQQGLCIVLTTTSRVCHRSAEGGHVVPAAMCHGPNNTWVPVTVGLRNLYVLLPTTSPPLAPGRCSVADHCTSASSCMLTAECRKGSWWGVPPPPGPWALASSTAGVRRGGCTVEVGERERVEIGWLVEREGWKDISANWNASYKSW